MTLESSTLKLENPLYQYRVKLLVNGQAHTVSIESRFKPAHFKHGDVHVTVAAVELIGLVDRPKGD